MKLTSQRLTTQMIALSLLVTSSLILKTSLPPNEEAWVDYLFKREFVWFEQETQTFVLSIKWPEMDGMDQFKMLFDFEKTLETDGKS